jgi:tetratricopeptide (TPR) repeat protein
VKFLSFLLKKKSGEKTLDEYRQLAKDEPDNIGVHMKIADMCLKKGKKEDAIKEYLYSAESYAKEELYQLTMSIYKTVLSLDPTLVNVYLTLAELYQKLGFIGDAAATYEKLAQYLLSTEKPFEVRNIIEKMINLDPSNRFIREKANKFLETLKKGYHNKQDSEEELIEVGENQPEYIKIVPPEEGLGGENYFDLGSQLDDGEELIVSTDRTETAKDESSMEVNKVFEGIIKGIAEKPKEEAFRLHYELGIAYQQMERIDEAIEEFKKALDDPEVKNDCFRRLATCFRDKEMFKHAINAAKSGLKSRFVSQREFLELNYELGLTYAEMKESKKALEVFNDIQKVNPSYKDTKIFLDELSKG